MEKWDEHWMPVSLRCRQSPFILFIQSGEMHAISFSSKKSNLISTVSRVCQLPFRYVIKYENLAEEWPHLLHRWKDLQSHKIDSHCPVWESLSFSFCASLVKLTLTPQFGSERRRPDRPGASLGESGSRGCWQPQGWLHGQAARGDLGEALQQGCR